MWTIVGPAPSRGLNKYVLAQCDCGDRYEVSQSSIRSGRSTQCRNCRHRAQETEGIGSVIASYKANARTRRLVWDLTDHEAENLLRSDCHYCGDVPSREYACGGAVPVLLNGIDRRDSEHGYYSWNSVPCCTRCNYIKRDMDYDDFIELCKRIAERF